MKETRILNILLTSPKEESPEPSHVREIALLGQPNTGKSTIFNALTGARQHVGNWPGKTVERKTGFFTFMGKEYSVLYRTCIPSGEAFL